MKKFSRKVRKAVRVLCSKELVFQKRKNQYLEEEVADLKKSLTFMVKKATAEEMQQQISNYQETIENLMIEKQTLEKENQKLFISIAKRVQERDVYKKRMTDAEATSQKRYDEIIELSQRVSELEKKLNVKKPFWKKVFKC